MGKTLRLMKTLRLAFFGAAVALSLPHLQAVVLTDPFTDGNKAGGADNSGINWFDRSVNTTLSINNTAAPTLTGNALHLNMTANASLAGTDVKNRGLVGVMNTTFTPTEIGHYISLTFDFQIRATQNNTTATPPATFTTSPSASLAGLTFGFYSSNGTNHIADNGTESDNDKGFRASIATGPTAATNLYRETNSAAGGLGVTDSGDSVDVTDLGATAVAINDFAKHTAELSLTLTSLGTYTLAMKVDGATVATGTSATMDYNSFDEIVFSQGGGNNISFDNVVVTIIPEPATALIGAFGLLTLLRRRR